MSHRAGDGSGSLLFAYKFFRARSSMYMSILPGGFRWAVSSENVSSNMRKMCGFTSFYTCTKFH